MRGVSANSMRDPGKIVTEDINWEVAAGEYWVVGGLQGTGKSDFLMMTGGLMGPSGGDYRLFGEPMPIFEERRLQERLRLGFVFETGQLLNNLTVAENIALPLRYHKNLGDADAAGQVEQFLEAMELRPWADSTPGMLGRSWQKRAGLARALILRPEVLLLDGPLTGLDLRHAYWWMSFLDRLSRGHELLEKRPLTLVVTTADLRPWRNRSCRFAVLREKRFQVITGLPQLDAESAGLLHETPPESQSD